MPDFPDEADELAAIHAAFAIPVRYTGAGLSDQEIAAVESEAAAADFIGAGSTLRQNAFEILFGTLPDKPGLGDRIEHPDGSAWRVNDITRHRSAGAWVVIVEEVQ